MCRIQKINQMINWQRAFSLFFRGDVFLNVKQLHGFGFIALPLQVTVALCYGTGPLSCLSVCL